MRRRTTNGAGGHLLRPRPHPRIAALGGAFAILVSFLAADAAAVVPHLRTAVGKATGRVAGPRMDPVVVPARVSEVAVVPGSKEREAWAFGHTHARLDNNWAQTDPQGQGVLLFRRRGTGWRIAGPLRNAEGIPTQPGVAAIAMASNGEGWGVGYTGLIFHRPPGGQWRIDAAASAVSPNDLFGIALRTDAGGVYGFAVGAGPTFLRLADGRWSVDNAAGARAGAEILGNLVAVVALDRDNAWAVASSARELVLYRRTATQGWTRQLTGKALFDTAPSVNGGSGGTPTINQLADGGAVAAAGRTVWIAGALQPVDPQRYVAQRGQPGSEPTRPFAIRVNPDGTMASYCPPIYQLSDGGVSSTVSLCDRPFPMAVGKIHALQGFPDGQVIAGGVGLFRFDGLRWVREPNVAGLISSASFHSPTEGWVASNGNRSGEGLAASTSNSVGHWTTDPPAPSVLARWPYPSRASMEGVALEPGGDGAVAVGGDGTIAMLQPGVGFDLVRSPTMQTLHDVAWPAPALAFAVGGRGTILRFDGRSWRADPASGRLTTEALHAVAFGEPKRGVAVGAAGTILRFDGSRWSRDPQSGRVTLLRLMAVDFAGQDVLAVGERSTILVNSGSGWVRDATAPERFKTTQEGRYPNLMAVAGLPDGRAFAGGELSLLIERRLGGRFERARSLPILSGSIHVLKVAPGQDGGVRAVASVGTSGSRFGGSGLLESTGWLFVGDGNEWRTGGLQRVAETGVEVDAPVQHDAVFDVALASDGRGFVVGGFPADLQDQDGHLGSHPSGSIWRISLGGSPEPAPGQHAVPVRTPAGATGFAFLADTACAYGLCSAAMGMGIRPDELLMRALSDVEDAAVTGAVRFIAFGGDLRRIGIPDELGPMRDLFDSLSVPVFGAIGDQDLFGGVGAGGENLLASAGYFLESFANRPAPWGSAAPPRSIVPVRLGTETPARTDQARTHFAFDYLNAGRPALRMVFLDTSRSTQQIALQNPPADQDPWVQQLLSSARSEGIPSIVVMHQPLLLGLSTGAGTRAGSLTPAITAGNPAAVLASHERVNRLLTYPLNSGTGVPTFPVAILGTSGSPLAQDWRPERGAYHAWFHIVVPAAAGRPPVIRSIPILESVALSAPQGRTAGAGGTLRFTGLARLPDVGGGHVSSGGSPAQVRAQYLSFPYPRPCGEGLPGEESCTPTDALRPDHEFACGDERICAFVAEDPQRPGTPARTQGNELIPDPHGGMMCAFAPGQTFVSLRVGTVEARVPIEVRGGEGPCIPARLPDIAVPVVLGTKQIQPKVIARQEEPAAPALKPKTFEVAAIPALAPPPVQPAPAPPGGGAPKYEEERESATESAEMTALPVAARSPSPYAGGAVGLALVTAAFALGCRMKPRPQQQYAWARTAGISSRRRSPS